MTEQNTAIAQNSVEGSKSVKRFEALDGFRGIAALWIVIFHLLLNKMTNVGQYAFGTTAFLVISGFAILHSVTRFSWESRTAVSFVKRRFLRIYGPYLLCLLFAGFLVPIACAIIEALKGRPGPVQFYPYTFVDWIQVVSLVRVFSSGSWELSLAFAPLGVNWYLSVIVQMYLMVALAIVFRSQKFLWFVTFLSILVLLPSVQKFVPYGLFLPYWLPFSIGMALSYAVRKGCVLRLGRQNYLPWYVASICAYCAGASLMLRLFYSPFFFALAFGFLLWLLYPIDERVAGWLPWRAFKIIGLMSYSLYLVHTPLSKVASEFTPNPSRFPTNVTHPFLWAPLTIFMSYLWFVFFQRPGSLRGYLLAVMKPFTALKAAFHEDWQNVFPSKQTSQEKDKELGLIRGVSTTDADRVPIHYQL